MPKIQHFSSYGKRQEKYDLLNKSTIENIPWQELELSEPYYFFVPKDFGVKQKYDKGFSVTEIFKDFSAGIVTSRDDFIIDNDKDILLKRVYDFLNSDLTDIDLQNKYTLKENSSFKISEKRKLKYDENYISKIDFRPFDTKYIYYDSSLLERGREKIMKNYIDNNNIGLVIAKQCVTDWKYIFISKSITDLNLTGTAGKYGSGSNFPLYIYQQNPLEQTEEKTPNFNSEIIAKIEEKLKLKLNSDFTPENLFDYIYAVLHSKTYRETYREFLKIDFPKIPFDVSQDTFFALVKLGEELRSYHLLENPNLIPKNFITKYEIDGDNKVEKVKFENEKVYINDSQYFSGVPSNIWKFYIGGYQPAQKWLKDRKDRNLNYEDIIHYSKMILGLNETIRIMEEIESIFKLK